MILCQCGCGQVVKKGNKYIHGHNMRGKERPDVKERNFINNPTNNPKVRKKLKGKNNPNYGIKNRPWLEGENHPMKKEKNRLKVSIKLKGRKNFWMYGGNNSMTKQSNREKARQRLKGKQFGKDNPNWKGGISYDPYCEQWLDQDYKESIKQRDGYICLNPECNKTNKQLCIHHIDYNKKNCHPFNLITICVSCNSKANKDRRWHKEWYKAIIKQRYS